MKDKNIVILLFLITGLLSFAIGCLLGQQPAKPQYGIVIPETIALFQTSLSSKIDSDDTSMTLVSGTDADGNELDGTYGFIIDEGSSNEEFVQATCSGTSCTSMTRGISVADGKTEVEDLQYSHRRGSSVKMTNYPLLAILQRTANGAESFPNELYYDDSLSSNFSSTASTSA